jgi:hypothetical protein
MVDAVRLLSWRGSAPLDLPRCLCLNSGPCGSLVRTAQQTLPNPASSRGFPAWYIRLWRRLASVCVCAQHPLLHTRAP